MGTEGYSREAFEKNEKKINETRDLAREKPFGFRADPGDVMSAKWNYMAGKQERERLLDLAHDEANKENSERSEGKSKKLTDFAKLVIETESGNRYIIQQDKSGEKYMVANFNTGDISEIPTVELEDTMIVKGKSVSFGSFGHTSSVKSAKGYYK